MLELLRDPLWQFVGAFLAVLALVATFIVYTLQRHRKSIVYDVLSRTSLLTVREEVEGKLEVRYEGHPVKSLSLLVIKVWNAGNQPIRTEDYERPVSFCLGDSAHILTSDITAADPPSISAEVHSSDNIATLRPTLLNPGDSLTLKFLVRDADGRVCPDARIVGVKEIRRAPPRTRQFALLTSAGMVLLATGAYILFTNRPPSAPRPPMATLEWLGVAIAVSGYAMLFWGLLTGRKLRVLVSRLRAAG